MRNIFTQLTACATVLLMVSCGGNDTKTDAASAKDAVKEKTHTHADGTKHSMDNSMKNKITTENVESTGNAAFDFDNTTFDFGNIKQGEVASHTFTFKNTGTEPLIISSAKGSCGCTVPTYSKTPIPPGEMGEIAVRFNSKGKSKKQNKVVTIKANTTPNTTRLKVTGFVEVAAKK